MNPETPVRRVLFRVDGSRQLGHGHVFRSLVLADELRARGAEVCFLCRELEGAPLDRIEARGHELVVLDRELPEPEEAKLVVAATRDRGRQWLVVDRYLATPDFYRSVRAEGLAVLAIDDINHQPFPVDILMNQNAEAPALDYRVEPGTTLLMGPEYALVAPRYREARPSRPPQIDRAERVLLFMGGGDAGNATGAVLRALERIDHRALEIDVVVGGGSPFVDEIREQAARHPHRVRVEQDLEDLVDVMLAADACVCAGGSTVWELCCLGVPMAWLTVADNQRSIVAELERRGCGISLGEAASCAPASLTRTLEDWVEGRDGRLAAQADAAWQLVDGRGAERVATRMQQTSLGNATS